MRIELFGKIYTFGGDNASRSTEARHNGAETPTSYTIPETGTAATGEPGSADQGAGAGLILGYKGLNLSFDGRFMLLSQHNQSWWIGGELKALCHSHHHAPHELCQCGIYLTTDPGRAYDLPIKVACIAWGKVIEHEYGYRVEYAKVESIIKPSCHCGRRAAFATPTPNALLCCILHLPFDYLNTAVPIQQMLDQLGVTVTWPTPQEEADAIMQGYKKQELATQQLNYNPQWFAPQASSTMIMRTPNPPPSYGGIFPTSSSH